MANHIFKNFPFRCTEFLLLAAVFFVSAGPTVAQTKTNERQPEAAPVAPAAPRTQRREENKKPPDTTRYFYEFTQPDFFIRHIIIEHDATGVGKITFERKGEETPIVEPINLSMGALGRVLGAWTELNFLQSTENYQADKQFPHLGTMRIGMERGERKRVAEFNWTNNSDAEALVNEYRKAADQVILVFDIAIARENQPLNAPKLMETMESMLKRNALSDPRQLLKLLQDLSTDEHVPLIARNHALRLIKQIQK